MTDAYFQNNLYEFLTKYLTENDKSPSFSELTQAMGISPNSKSLITRSLRALSKKGKIVLKRDGRRLSISLSQRQLRLMGRIAAGEPIEAISEYRSIDVDGLLQGHNHFALQVKGNSMIDDGIHDGDIVICKQANAAKEGDIVIALIDQNNATLKRISYKMKDMITLIPSNSDLKPRAYLPERIFIQGIYVGLVRVIL